MSIGRDEQTSVRREPDRSARTRGGGDGAQWVHRRRAQHRHLRADRGDQPSARVDGYLAGGDVGEARRFTVEADDRDSRAEGDGDPILLRQQGDVQNRLPHHDALRAWLTPVVRGRHAHAAELIVGHEDDLVIVVIQGVDRAAQRGLTYLSPFVMTGLLGGFTTFSAFALETSHLMRDGQYLWAMGNVLGQNVLGIAALIVGLILGRLL